MKIKGHDKVRNMADNTMKMTSTMVLLNQQGLKKEQDVLNQLDDLLDIAVKKLTKLENLKDTHVDNQNILGDYKIQEQRVKELSASRELSEEAVKQFELNLENLGVKTEDNE